MDQRLFELFTPIIYGSSKVASYHRKTLNLNEFNINLIKKAEFANPKRANIINCFENEVKIELGRSSPIAGEVAFGALEMATKDLLDNQIDLIVTAPINKSNIQSDKFRFHGHTEYLASKFKSEDHLMLMIYDDLKIGVITGHYPIKDVSKVITKELVSKKINILNQSLISDFKVMKPKIAVLGLNPHAGDDGLLGDEEQKILNPAIKDANSRGILTYGPFAADGFFGSAAYKKFDAVLATYHDQGMIPFKTIAFDEGVNFTAGLPYVRTSPAHGTGYDIAGQNLASPESFRRAIYLALDLFRNRREYQTLTADVMVKSETGDYNNNNEVE